MIVTQKYGFGYGFDDFDHAKLEVTLSKADVEYIKYILTYQDEFEDYVVVMEMVKFIEAIITEAEK